MLGARTKQVYSYGKRSQRIVNVSEDHDRPKNAAPSIFDDLPPTQWAPIASKMKKRENAVPTKSKSPSPKVVHMNRKKRLSPVLSPLKRRTRAAQVIHAETRQRQPSLAKSKQLSGENDDAIGVDISPPRAPLAPFSLNVPGSPAVSGKLRDVRRLSAQAARLRLNKPFLPYLDVEITVLDKEGKTVSKERRVSRSNLEANPFNQSIPTQSKSPHKKAKPIPVDSDSEVDIIKPVKLSRPVGRRKHLTIYSDDSESDHEPVSPPLLPTLSPSPESQPKPNLARNASSRAILEIVVPPAPYSFPSNAPPHTSPLNLTPQLSPQYSFPPRYQQLSSPTIKPRQLTPIRGGRGRHFPNPPSPPSPFTCTDLDLSLDFGELSLTLSLDGNTSNYTEPEIPEYLRPLLEECHQETCGPIDFSSFIDTFPFDPIVRSKNDQPSQTQPYFKKIGEASYSEVFGIGDVVLKVIPLRDESVGDNKLKINGRYNEDGEEMDGPAPSDAKDVRKEIIVTRAMGEVCDGFVELLKTYVVRGKYPEVLLRLWDDYHAQKGSESVRPDSFLVSQVYAIIVLPNGGPDLEAYKFINPSKMGWRQASSLFWQVAKALAHAEQLVSFEHRDLHWGQILVKNLPIATPTPLKAVNQNQKSKPKPTRPPMDDPAHGVRATLIDLGLSRMDAGDGAGGERVHWTPFEDEVFMGEGDYQFDVYRIMKDWNGGSWESFNPQTNVMWLHYLTLKLLQSKRLKPPTALRKGRATEIHSPDTAAFTERDCYECLLDIEGWLNKCMATLSPAETKPKGKNKKKLSPPKANSTSPSCAGEVVAYAVKKGWINPTS